MSNHGNNTSKTIEPIAYIRSDFPEKFGIPRQSGLARTRAEIVFTPAYRNADAVRGLDGFSHIWLIWEFSGNRTPGEQWSPTVRPPRLGGNTRVGVFASRSPFRPNGLGLSCVRLISVVTSVDTSGAADWTADGAADGSGTTGTNSKEYPVLVVEGADLMDGTPIYDIKPYVPYADSHPDASGGFTDQTPRETLRVLCPDKLLRTFPAAKKEGLLDLLAQDPRPSYQHDPNRVYGLGYAGFNIKFRVKDSELTVLEIKPADPDQ